jgi:hypothetical protein
MTLSKSKVNLRLGLKVGGYLRIDDWTSMLLRRYLLLPCRQEMFSATEVQPLLPPPPNSDNEFKPHMLETCSFDVSRDKRKYQALQCTMMKNSNRPRRGSNPQP